MAEAYKFGDHFNAAQGENLTRKVYVPPPNCRQNSAANFMAR